MNETVREAIIVLVSVNPRLLINLEHFYLEIFSFHAEIFHNAKKNEKKGDHVFLLCLILPNGMKGLCRDGK